MAWGRRTEGASLACVRYYLPYFPHGGEVVGAGLRVVGGRRVVSVGGEDVDAMVS